MITDRRIC